jgi:hypothetical protein
MIGGPSVPPLPMVTSVADLLVRHLRRAGVDCIFGVPEALRIVVIVPTRR